MEVKTVISQKRITFYIQQYGDTITIGCSQPQYCPNWLGQLHVYDVADTIKLECTNEIRYLRGIPSLVFNLGKNTLQDVEEAVRDYSGE